MDFSGAHPVIYATTAESSANRLVAIIDTGAASPANTLATAGVNQIFRGVAFTPDAAIPPAFFFNAGNANNFTNGFAISWGALLNRNYSVQWNGDITTTNWVTFTNLTSTLPTITVIDTSAPAGTNRFYRIILNP